MKKTIDRSYIEQKAKKFMNQLHWIDVREAAARDRKVSKSGTIIILRKGAKK